MSDNRKTLRPVEEADSMPSFPEFRTLDDEATQTIDVDHLFYDEATDSGSFNLSRIKFASFGRLLEALSVPTLLINRSHIVEFANAAFGEISGDGSDVEGSRFSSLFPNPEESHQAATLLEKVFNDRKATVRERVLKIKNTTIWGRMHLRTIRLGSEQMALVQIENLTAEKELVTVQKYKRLVNIFPIGIAEFAIKGVATLDDEPEDLLATVMKARVTDGNNEFARIYDRKNIRDLMRIPLRRFLPATGRGIQVYEKWIHKGFPIRSFESRETSEAMGEKHFENTLIANISRNRLLGFWWLKKDISDKKQREDEILRSQKLESLGILAGGLAHDFNNLLTAILGNISLSQIHLDPSNQAIDRMESAAKAAARAKSLTRQLLTFAQGGAPIKSACSIAEMLVDCSTFVLRGSNVNSEFDIPEDLWSVEVDEGQISQVINNLIINAAQAMPDGGTVDVKASNEEVQQDDTIPLKSGKYVKISIIDPGVGIPREHLPKIFDPYFTTKEKGSGLGLATSYSIVSKHGGFITVESESGQGTAVHFYLPATDRAGVPYNRPLTPPVMGEGYILIMDDEEMIRELAGDLLMALGYEIEYASDGAEALELYVERSSIGKPFDAVIMDLTIPGGMGGKETMQRLLRIDPHVKAIVSSGYFNDPIMSDYEAYGFKGVLPKPYDGKQLSEVLAEVLRG